MIPESAWRLGPKRPADLIVVLSHLGFPQDVKLANRMDGVDVIVSGHAHNRLDRPVWRDMLIQSGCHGSFIGRLDLTIEGRRIAGVRHRLIPVDETIAPDPEMDALIENVMALTDPCWPRWSATPALGFTETPIMIRPWMTYCWQPSQSGRDRNRRVGRF